MNALLPQITPLTTAAVSIPNSSTTHFQSMSVHLLSENSEILFC